MIRPSLARILKTALLLLALAVPVARAEEPASPATRGAADLFSLTDLVGQVWGGFMSLWPDNGCGIDPDGGCRSEQALDNGCIIDPSGGCATVSTPDNGCIADPNGGCRFGS